MIQMSDKRESLDALTNIWTAETAGRLIGHYLVQSEEPGGDALFLLELTGWEAYKTQHGDEAAQALVRKAAYRIQQSLRRTDLAARVGENVFVVFLLGCRSRRQALKKAGEIREKLAGEIRLSAGIVLCSGEIKDYDTLLKNGKAALRRAGREPSGVWFVTDQEETGAEGEWEFSPIPPAGNLSGKADMEFVGRMMEFFMDGIRDKEEIEAGLGQLGDYFDAGRVYLVMKADNNKNYEVFYEWERQPSQVCFENLKIISGILGDRYGTLFDSCHLLVCSRLEDLERLDPIMAERQRLLGTQAMLQYAVVQAGEFTGYLCLADAKGERMWTQKEVATFSMAGKAVAAGILQLRFEALFQTLMSHDMLTEAWNYNQFLSEGARYLNRSPLRQAVVSLDIKNFKNINQQYGYETGNQVLVELSSLLHYFTGEDEKYARIEADKFALLLEYQSNFGLERRLEQLIRRIERIPEGQSFPFTVSCILGVCLVRPGDCDMSVLVDHANLARKARKHYHKSSYSFYNEEVEKRLKRDQEYALVMKEALDREEFVVYYQPKISLASKRCIGMEALVRWQMGDGHLVPPDEFIPLFEKNGFITELDLYVFRRVCALLAGWKQEGKKILPVAVNISRVHIREKDFLETLVAICDEYGIETGLLELEITESAFLQDSGIILQVAEQISEQGFVLSMDDFGTGYSSLSLLKDLPVDIIKLDREFFRKEMSERERIIVSNVIHMAKQLHIQVVSEGIETRENEQFLEEIGCEYAQGYRYSRPVPIEELMPMIEEAQREE